MVSAKCLATLHLRVKIIIINQQLIWWRRGELNPRPQALDFRIYARS